jgi:hypothetical protein
MILVYYYPQIYYQWLYLICFVFLLQNFLCAIDYMLLIMRKVFFFSVAFSETIVFMSPHIKNSVFGSYRYFKVSSRLSMNGLNLRWGLYINLIQLILMLQFLFPLHRFPNPFPNICVKGAHM